jgi:hypothetical protein
MEGVGIVGVPEHHDLVADTIIVESIAEAAHRLGSVPLLSQDDHVLPLSQRWLDHTVLDKPGNGLVEIGELVALPVIDPSGVILANPLTPPMQDEFPSPANLFSRSRGIANEKKMRGKAQLRQRAGQVLDSGAKSPSHGIWIGAFKAQDDDLGILGGDVSPVHTPTSAGLL